MVLPLRYLFAFPCQPQHPGNARCYSFLSHSLQGQKSWRSKTLPRGVPYKCYSPESFIYIWQKISLHTSCIAACQFLWSCQLSKCQVLDSITPKVGGTTWMGGATKTFILSIIVNSTSKTWLSNLTAVRTTSTVFHSSCGFEEEELDEKLPSVSWSQYF